VLAIEKREQYSFQVIVLLTDSSLSVGVFAHLNEGDSRISLHQYENNAEMFSNILSPGEDSNGILDAIDMFSVFTNSMRFEET